MTPKKSFPLTIIITLALLLSGCLSLAEDITPPPGMEAQPPPKNTPLPQPTPTVMEPEDAPTPADPNDGPANGFGDITVNVFHAEGDDLPAGLEVVLRGYEEMTQVFTKTLTLDEGTAVTFEDVPLPEGRMLFATIEHQNAAYGSDIQTVEAETFAPSLEITYYAPTTDPAILAVDRLHLFLDFVDENTLEVFQLYIFSNPSNQILTPVEDGGVAVNFTIPAEASNLSVEESRNLAYRKTADGFGIVNVYPAAESYQVVYTYQVPYQGRKLDLSVPIGMNANAVIVMAPATGFRVESDSLQESGRQDIEGLAYIMYTGSNLNAGDPLEMSLSGRPKRASSILSTESNSKNTLVVGLAGFGLALIGAGIYFWRRNQADDDPLEGSYDDELLTKTESAEDLMDAIIALDDQFKLGGLPERAYRARREELKERLRERVEYGSEGAREQGRRGVRE